MLGIWRIQTEWRQWTGVLLLTILLLIYEDVRRGRWQKSVLWVIIILFTYFVAGYDYGRELAFRNISMGGLVEAQSILVQGRLYKKELKNEHYRYYLKDCSIDRKGQLQSCNSIIVYFQTDDYSLDDFLRVKGKIKLFESARNQGQFDAEVFYQSQKIDFSICDGKVLACRPRRYRYKEWLYQCRGKMVQVLEQNMKPEYAGVLSSMLFGDKSMLDEEMKTLYQKAGISHILAISGLHISLIGMTLYGFLRKRGMGFGASGVLAGLCILLYGQMTGWAVSTERAVGMMLLVMLARLLGRTNDLLNSLGFMVLVLLGDNPFLLQYAGFTFSVMAICGVGITGLIFKNVSSDVDNNEQESKGFWKKIQSWREGVWVSVGISLTTLPLTAYYYYEIPLYSVFLNMLVLPVMGLLFILGISGSLLGLKGKVLSAICLRLVELFLEYDSLLCSLVGRLPGGNIIVGKPSDTRMALYYLIFGACLFSMCFFKKIGIEVGEKKKSCIRLATVMILCVILFMPKGTEAQITFLDVGQGDGIYIESSEGIHLFIDGGSTSVNQVGTYRILPFLKSHGVGAIDYWFVSHGDDDHINGLMELLEQGYPIHHLLLAKYMVEDENYTKLVQLAKEGKTQIQYMKTGDVMEAKDLRVQCLFPKENLFEDKNDMSLVLEIGLGDIKGIFAGDISSEAEGYLVKNHLLENIDFYKVNHHGSKYSSDEKFLAQIDPEISIVSCGKKNRYGHPARETIERLELVDSKIYYTMNNGQITLTSEGRRGMKVKRYVP